MADQPAVLAEDVTRHLGQVHALTGVALAVTAGTIVALLAPNGAGKTTLVRVPTTDTGQVLVHGVDAVTQPYKARRVIGLSFQYAAVDAYLTGRENPRVIGRLCRLGNVQIRRRAGKLIDLVDLGDAADRMARTYPGGMRRRLDVSASLVGAPPVLSPDEPTTGLDPRGRLGLYRYRTTAS